MLNNVQYRNELECNILTNRRRVSLISRMNEEWRQSILLSTIITQ